MGADVAGTWDATVVATGGTAVPPNTVGTAVVTLTKVSTMVSGTFVFDDGDSGDITGAVSGQQFDFVVTQTTPGCAGRFIGTARVVGDRGMFGTYSGSSCGGTLEADFEATKR